MLSALSWIGFGQSCLFILAIAVLFHHWNARRWLLLAIAVCVAIGLLRLSFIASKIEVANGFWMITSAFAGFALLPLCHLLVVSLLNPNRVLTIQDGLHFIAPFITALLAVWAGTQFSGQSGMPLYQLSEFSLYELAQQRPWSFPLIPALLAAQGVAYVLANGFYLKCKSRSANETDRLWAARITGFNALIVFVVCSTLTASALTPYLPVGTAMIISVMMNVMVMLGIIIWGMMKYKSLLKSDALLEVQVQTEPESGMEPETKYAKSGLSQTRMKILCDRAIEAIHQHQLHLKPDFSLPELASHVGCSTNHLSQSINCQLQRGFHDLINELRVNEAKQSLECSQGKSVLDIAMESGFNSKSSFYALFKKSTGLTPGAYKKQYDSLQCP